ncbi:hypothetical protein B5X24_HaOG216637 [Helicoverpa armigera]|nr:hypothetical protein B5X24_HaOG216637 [Helicoverpa armigera]
MNCIACGGEPTAGELIKCNGCKAGYHYTCANITKAAFTESQVQLRRTFKCDSCSNVTQRVRITDDTPVRGVSAATTKLREMNKYPERTASHAESWTSEQIVEKVNSAILAKLSLFESTILQEIKDTVATLALENSKLRQELNAANMKCISYEQQIKNMELERQISSLQPTVSSVSSCDTCVKVNNIELGSRSAAAAATASTPAAAVPPPAPAPPPETARPAQTTYAAVASKAADSKVNDNGWVEVRSKWRNNSIKRGGNNNSIGSLKAVERKKFLHVWRLEKNTTETDLKEYVKQVLGVEDDSGIYVEKLKPKTERDYSSFKIGITITNFEKLCDPEAWPVNVEYCEWIWFRPSTKPTTSTTQ